MAQRVEQNGFEDFDYDFELEASIEVDGTRIELVSHNLFQSDRILALRDSTGCMLEVVHGWHSKDLFKLIHNRYPQLLEVMDCTLLESSDALDAEKTESS